MPEARGETTAGCFTAVAFSTATGDMILRDPPVPSQILRIKLDTPLPPGG